MRTVHAVSLLRDGTLDAELAALLWLLGEGNVPLVVAGAAARPARAALAAAMLSLDGAREWVLLDADRKSVTAERLTALLRGGVLFGVTVAADDLASVIQRLTRAGLPEDGVRRLGVVIIADGNGAGLRCAAVHYLRPTERDGQGHLQRRPPAVLATWDPEADAYEHFAWGVTPELADRVDRSQADFEERQHERALFLAAAAGDTAGEEEQRARIGRYLASEPPREPAPPRQAAQPSRFEGGLTDPDPHAH